MFGKQKGKPKPKETKQGRGVIAVHGQQYPQGGATGSTGIGILKDKVDACLLGVIDAISKSGSYTVLGRADVSLEFEKLSKQIRQLKSDVSKGTERRTTNQAHETDPRNAQKVSENKELRHAERLIRWLEQSVTQSNFDVPSPEMTKQNDLYNLELLKKIEESVLHIWNFSKSIYGNLQKSLDSKHSAGTDGRENLNKGQMHQKDDMKHSKQSGTSTPQQTEMNTLQAENRVLSSKLKIAEEELKNFKQKQTTEKSLNLKELLDSKMAENRKLRAECMKAEESVEYWRNRVSKMAGAKLTDGNPGITDLSDPNRPSKLSEMFSEIYYNIWTDTLEQLTKDELKQRKLDEKEAVQHLASILYECYNYCQGKFHDKLKKIEYVLIPSVENTTEVSRSGSDKSEWADRSRLDKEEAKQLKDLLKLSGVKAGKCFNENLLKIPGFTDNFGEDIAEACAVYISKCINVCWLIAVNERQPYLQWDVDSKTPIDEKIFRPYKTHGSLIDYIVWPALFVYHDAPVLCTRVAEAIED